MTTELANDVTGAPPVGISAWLGRIVCGDNTEVLSGFPDACIDLVVTSPPYDDLRTYGGHSWNFETLAAQLVRVLKPGGVIVWVVADKTEDGSETGTSMEQALHFRRIGLRLHDTMIWKRLSLPLNHNRYEQEFEFMFVLSKGKPRVFNGARERCVSYGRAYPGGSTRQGGDDSREHNTKRDIKEDRLRGNVWEIETGYMKATKDVQAYDHPAIFPEELAKLQIQSWSNPGDVILDPFSGSGTTCKAAKELNRQWCGIEINPEYCAIAEARLSQDVLQLETCAMRPNTDSQTKVSYETLVTRRQ
jgi:site-specific DNA-methyltransferase (adenine-specific)